MVDIAKIVNTDEIETATPAEVAEAVFSNDDVEIFTTEQQTKLAGCKEIPVITQDEYDAIPTKDTNVIYAIRPEV